MLSAATPSDQRSITAGRLPSDLAASPRLRAAGSSGCVARRSVVVANDVGWAPLRLQEDEPDVLADDAQAEELDRSHEQHGHQGAGPALGHSPVVQSVAENPDQEDQGDADRDDPQVGHQPQGVAAEADQAVDGQHDQGTEGVLGLAPPREPARS